MKKLAVIVAALSLSACGTLIPASATVAVAQGDTTLDATYNVAAQAYIAALPTMPANIKATVQPLLVKAYPYVVAADKAEALGDAAGVAAQTGAAMTLISQARVALGAN